MSLRVLWISHFVPFPPAGGVLQRGYGLLSRMAPYCEIHLLAMHQPRLFAQSAVPAGVTIESAAAELRKLCATVEIVQIPSESRALGRALSVAIAAVTGKSYTESWLWSPEMNQRTAMAFGRYQPDIAHFDTISLAPYIPDRGAGVGISLGHHNIESHMLWRRATNTNSLVVSRLLRVEAARVLSLERHYSPMADVNVVCSRLDARRLARLTGARSIHVAENGVLSPEWNPDGESTSAPSAPSHARLVFVGRMSAYTNRDACNFLVSEIWPAVHDANQYVSLDIVGSGAPAAALELARTDSRVRVHGFVADLAPFTGCDAIFVCPVRDGGGTKLKILDAMNRGLPIVAHPVAVEGIDVIDGVHVMLARTPAEFAGAVHELAASRERRFAMSREAFSLVRRKYSFDAIAQGLLCRFEAITRHDSTHDVTVS